MINEVARAGEHTNERTNVRTYVLTYIRTGQTLYPLHNFVVRGDKKEALYITFVIMTCVCTRFLNLPTVGSISSETKENKFHIMVESSNINTVH